MTEAADEPVPYETETVPVDELRVGDALRVSTEAGELIVMVDYVRPYVRQDESGQDISAFELRFNLVEGAEFAAWHPLAGTLATRILPQPEP